MKFCNSSNSQKLRLVNDISSKVNSTAIKRSDSFKYLGIDINQTVSWSEHIHRYYQYKDQSKDWNDKENTTSFTFTC